MKPERWFVAALCLSMACALRAADAPPNTEKIDELIKQLSSDDFDTREAAANGLRKIGGAAWPRLEPLLRSEDKEVVARVRTLSRDLAVVRPDQQELATSLTAKLEDADAERRAEGLNGLLELGPAGIRILRKHLSGEGAKPAVKLQFDRMAVAAGEKISGKGILSNEGSAPFWISKDRAALEWRCTRNVPFGEPRPAPRFGMCGGARCVLIRRYTNPIMGFYATVPGKQACELPVESELNSVGIHTGYLYVLVDAITGKTIHPKIPDSALPDAGNTLRTVDEGAQDANTVALDFGKGLTEEQRRPRETIQLFALPPAGTLSSNTQLELQVLRADALKDDPKSSVCVTIKLNSKIAAEPLRLEQDLARYAWYALLDSKGVPVKWGSWRSALRGEDDAVLAARTLEPGKSAEWNLRIAPPEAAGDYALIAGYEVALAGDHQEAPVFNLPPDSPQNLKCYDTGRLATRLENIHIEAAQK